MSHWTAIDLQIKSIPALRAACQELGCHLTEGNTATGYSGMSTQVDMNITIPETRYTIGVKRNSDGTFKMVADFYNRKLRATVGENGNLLKQRYAICAAEQAARRKGYTVTRQNLNDGKIKLKVGVR